MKGTVIFTSSVDISSYPCEFFGLRVLVMFSVSVVVVVYFEMLYTLIL
jgi:hypothetical protein